MAAAAVCYTIGHDFVVSSNQYFPCGNSTITGAQAQSCCYSEDYCMEDNICHYERSGVTNGTGYYMAGCTDPTWKDPACPKQCTAEFTGDIIYNRADSQWMCCHSEEGYLNCQQPSDYAVDAPAPGALQTVVQISSVAPSSSVTTGIATVSISHTTVLISSAPASSKPSPTSHTSVAQSTPPVSEPLSAGAKAGIAIGVILLVLLVFGGGFLFYRRNRRRHDSFKHFNDADSQYSTRNRSHSLSTSVATRASRSTGSNTNRHTRASRMTAATTATGATAATSDAAYATNRNTYASSTYTHQTDFSSGLHMQQARTQSPPPPLPEGADGMQVVKQLPRTPDEAVFAENSEKGPFEMQVDEIEMRSRARPVSMQELEGTTVARAELDGGAVMGGRLVDVGEVRLVDVGDPIEEGEESDGEEREREEMEGEKSEGVEVTEKEQSGVVEQPAAPMSNRGSIQQSIQQSRRNSAAEDQT